MPIYEYRCESCAVELEILQKLSDPVLGKCPECGRESLKKLISASSFRLKGSGWYETDFKTANKRHGTADGSGEGADKAGERSGESTAESTAKRSEETKPDKPSKEPAKGAATEGRDRAAGDKPASKHKDATT